MKEYKEAYDMGYKAGYEAAAVVFRNDIEELNHRLAKRVIDFNETDKKRLHKIQELEAKLEEIHESYR